VANPHPEDVLSTIDYLINLELDWFGGAFPLMTSVPLGISRRVRSVGELLQNLGFGLALNRFGATSSGADDGRETESLIPCPAWSTPSPWWRDQGVSSAPAKLSQFKWIRPIPLRNSPQAAI